MNLAASRIKSKNRIDNYISVRKNFQKTLSTEQRFAAILKERQQQMPQENYNNTGTGSSPTYDFGICYMIINGNSAQ
jgi:hypothetical protein